MDNHLGTPIATPTPSALARVHSVVTRSTTSGTVRVLASGLTRRDADHLGYTTACPPGSTVEVYDTNLFTVVGRCS